MSQSQSKYGGESSSVPPEQTLSGCSLTYPRNTLSSSTLKQCQSCCRSRQKTPNHVQSLSRSHEKFCTSNTCQNFKNSKESPSPCCSYGVRNETQDNIPLRLNNKVGCRICKKYLTRTQESLYLLTKETQLPSTNSIKECCVQRPILLSMGSHQKLNESISGQASSNTTFQLSCKRLFRDEPRCAQPINPIRRPSILKRSDCGLSTCCTSEDDTELTKENNTTSEEHISPKHDIGLQTSIESIYPDKITKRQRNSTVMLRDLNNSNKFDVNIPATTCKENQQLQCKCRYPPIFKQFSCTGKITGNCDCCSKK